MSNKKAEKDLSKVRAFRNQYLGGNAYLKSLTTFAVDEMMQSYSDKESAEKTKRIEELERENDELKSWALDVIKAAKDVVHQTGIGKQFLKQLIEAESAIEQ